jgi:glutamate formiminotransferase/formiminotetrahydrofolate cyclodeaminase
MIYKDRSLKRYLDDLAARLPAPGGGSAAALGAALAAALLSMVVNFTLGKPRYAKYEEQLKKILEESEKLREEFLRLVDLDVQAFKSKDIRQALDVPFTVARLCFEGIKLCLPLAEKGNVNLISDVGVAAVLLESAFASACINVRINLKYLADKRLAGAIGKELAKKGKIVRKIRMETEDKVGKIIGG